MHVIISVFFSGLLQAVFLFLLMKEKTEPEYRIA